MSTVLIEAWEGVSLYGGNFVYVPNRVTIKHTRTHKNHNMLLVLSSYSSYVIVCLEQRY